MAYFCGMKKIFKRIRRWRNHRLFLRLFFLYADKDVYADDSGREAAKAFEWLTGERWVDQF